MMASGRLVDYLGKGLLADRPVSLTLHADAVGLYYSTDTAILSAWDGTVWVDVEGSPPDAIDTPYDNVTSGLVADNVQEAIDEIVAGLGTASAPIIVAVSNETTALTTGVAKVTFRMPYAFTLTGVRASVTTAPTGAALTVDINEGGVSILSTKLTIDATEKTSTTAAAAAVISDTALADDAEITIDIDTVGSTVAGAGLKVTLIGYAT